MKNIWITLVKPKGAIAKWLVFIAFAAIIVTGMTEHGDIVKKYTDIDEASFKIGDYKITLYQAMKAILIIVLIFWTAAIASDVAEKRIGLLTKVRAANKALILKLVQIGIYVISFVIALDILGIDLTTLTVFSGAVGIGLGFGLQKIASNFISGIILLLEKSVEEGDLIELNDGTFGFVRKAHARYTLIETFDSREILLPNEDFITSRVVNWTLSNTKGRIEINIGVSYNSDIKQASEIILAAAKAHPKCIKEPEPQCYLRNFGDSSVDFTLHFWVKDVTEGRWGPQSEVLFEIWNRFKEHGIEIPFPQRDIHIRSAETLQVKTTNKAKTVGK